MQRRIQGRAPHPGPLPTARGEGEIQMPLAARVSRETVRVSSFAPLGRRCPIGRMRGSRTAGQASSGTRRRASDSLRSHWLASNQCHPNQRHGQMHRSAIADPTGEQSVPPNTLLLRACDELGDFRNLWFREGIEFGECQPDRDQIRRLVGDPVSIGRCHDGSIRQYLHPGIGTIPAMMIVL